MTHDPTEDLLSSSLSPFSLQKTVGGKKDRSLFLFSDLIICTTLKRKSGSLRRSSMSLYAIYTHAQTKTLTEVERHTHTIIIQFPNHTAPWCWPTDIQKTFDKIVSHSFWWFLCCCLTLRYSAASVIDTSSKYKFLWKLPLEDVEVVKSMAYLFFIWLYFFGHTQMFHW